MSSRPLPAGGEDVGTTRWPFGLTLMLNLAGPASTDTISTKEKHEMANPDWQQIVESLVEANRCGADA
jgi:NADH pyrophosphatase NudC (nudix superfamily)